MSQNKHPLAPWRKSTYSGEGNGCVTVAPLDVTIGVKDSKLSDSPVQEFAPSAWTQFLRDGIR
ncbi:DUF397 domain-containing protein [Embleya sp. NPDC050154]|uniref:DUF397 domain-containing protein n=1 Tax=Embleya sp. NPDC050154 TaxID=3363988 RepID=UPI0037AFF5E2